MSKYGREVNRYLRKVQRGDKEQMGRLFELTANHLRAVALNYLIDKSYCDDVVSDVYCKVMQYIKSFDRKKDGYNWMCKITERVAYSYNEKVKEQNKLTVDIDTVANLGSEDKDADVRIEIFAAMEKLSPQDREIIYERFYLDMSYAQIAAKHGIAKSSVHKRIKRAYAAIKKYLLYGEQKE